jgi:hypothetical protein
MDVNYEAWRRKKFSRDRVRKRTLILLGMTLKCQKKYLLVGEL